MTITAELVTEHGPGGGWPVVKFMGDPLTIEAFLTALGFDPGSYEALDGAITVDWANDDGDTMTSVQTAISEWEGR